MLILFNCKSDIISFGKFKVKIQYSNVFQCGKLVFLIHVMRYKSKNWQLKPFSPPVVIISWSKAPRPVRIVILSSICDVPPYCNHVAALGEFVLPQHVYASEHLSRPTEHFPYAVLRGAAGVSLLSLCSWVTPVGWRWQTVNLVTQSYPSIHTQFLPLFL